MAKKIFVNLPVKDLKKTMEFYSSLGYTFNPQFTDENAASMVISEDIYAMFLVEPYFQSFSKKGIPDTKTTAQTLICLSAESREEVDELVGKALKAGGTAPLDKQDHGFMYGHGFQDLDGHMWEVMYMDMSAMPQG